MGDFLQNLFLEYKKVVTQNSEAIAQFESGFRLISYAIAGRFEDSTLLSELLYSASNLLVLFNDAIIKKTTGILPEVTPSQERLESIVTVLEYAGVFIELAAARSFGEVGKWVAITVVQLAKCVCRFLLLVKHSTGIQTVPPICPIDRSKVIEVAKSEGKLKESEQGNANNSATVSKASVTFTLKRSGKVMRNISSSPKVLERDWKLPQIEVKPDPKASLKLKSKPTNLTKKQTFGECLYILKPLVHLSGLYMCGTSSFKPLVVSAAMDLGSMCLLSDSAKLNPQEKSELQRRFLMLTMYFLRSPLYERYTKQRLLRILRALADNVPGLSIILVPLMEYLPAWQQIYFYTWSS